MRVDLDGAEPLEIESKTRDLAAAERLGYHQDTTKPMTAGYLVCFATLQRLARGGGLPEGFVVPESFDDFLVSADVEMVADDSPKASSPEPSTGS